MSGYPTPILHSSRIAFAIDYFATEAEADLAGEIVRKRGDSYNGGYFDGMPCGRDSGFDYERDGVTYYAVTVG